MAVAAIEELRATLRAIQQTITSTKHVIIALTSAFSVDYQKYIQAAGLLLLCSSVYFAGKRISKDCRACWVR